MVYAFDMSEAWPNLQVLELFVAVVDEGSVGGRRTESGDGAAQRKPSHRGAGDGDENGFA